MTTMTIERAVEVLDDMLGIRGYCNFEQCQAWSVAKAHLANGAQEWQPIETAPKGEEILVYSPLCAGTKSVEDWGKFCKYNSPIWTHWMPLPAAPMLSQRGEVES